MRKKIVGYIVIFCDGEGLDVPYTFAPGVPGGIESRSSYEPVAMFATRKEAQRAIRISTLAALLAKERNEIANDDFADPKLRKCVRIVAVVSEDRQV